MARTAKPLDEPEAVSAGDVFSGLLGLISRNPTLVGGTTAFLVAMSFVSANALWYQPHAHSGAFFATRDFVRPQTPVEVPQETTIIIERPETPPVVVEGDPTVKDVQQTLKDLNFYDGEIDGLYGPATRVAIETYQNKMGMQATGTVDDALLDHLGTGSVAKVVVPSPAPRDDAEPSPARTVSVTRDDLVARVQAGLKEFGNDDMEIDGLMGVKTEAAIREFQSLFGLPVTGQAEDQVYAKMREIGLID